MKVTHATRYAAWTASLCLATLFGYLVGFRGDEIGTDTANYRAHYYRVMGGLGTRFEPGIQLLMELSALVGESYVFFLFVFIIVVALHSSSAALLARQANDKKTALAPIFLIGLLFSSSWFITANINGIRQGISLSLFYFGAISYVLTKRRIIGIGAMLGACFLHYSTIVLIPLILITPYVSNNFVLIIFLSSAAAYPIGLFEEIFRLLEIVAGIEVYSFIKNYADSVPKWRGWQWDLWVYTVGWVAIYYVGIRFLVKEYKETVRGMLKIYMMFALPFFVLGFGSFSNRYGIMAWSILPLLHFSWFMGVRVTFPLSAIAAGALLVFGVVRFGRLLGLA